jgi:hypothetical protein
MGTPELAFARISRPISPVSRNCAAGTPSMGNNSDLARRAAVMRQSLHEGYLP